MATIRLSRLILADGFPGDVDDNLGVPANGWDNTTDNFKTTSADGTSDAWLKGTYPMGTKIKAYTDNSACPGWYTMMYAAFHCYTKGPTTNFDITGDFSESAFMCSKIGQGCSSQTMFDTSAAPWYVLGNCFSSFSSDLSCGSPLAIPCTSMSGDGTLASLEENGYGDSFGWFWVGGVCPCKDVTILQGLGGSLQGADITCTVDRGPFCCGTQGGGYPLLVLESTVGTQGWASICSA